MQKKWKTITISKHQPGDPPFPQRLVSLTDVADKIRIQSSKLRKAGDQNAADDLEDHARMLLRDPKKEWEYEDGVWFPPAKSVSKTKKPTEVGRKKKTVVKKTVAKKIKTIAKKKKTVGTKKKTVAKKKQTEIKKKKSPSSKKKQKKVESFAISELKVCKKRPAAKTLAKSSKKRKTAD